MSDVILDGRPEWVSASINIEREYEYIIGKYEGRLSWLTSNIRIAPLQPFVFCIEYEYVRYDYFRVISNRCFGKPVYTRWKEESKEWKHYQELSDADTYIAGVPIYKIKEFVSVIEAENFIKEKIEESKKEAAFMSQKPVEFVRS